MSTYYMRRRLARLGGTIGTIARRMAVKVAIFCESGFRNRV